MNGAAISLRNVFQSYGKQPVLEDVSLEIPRGQTFALLGRNGSGKTTLIRTLLGLLPPVKGAAEVLGLDPSRQALEIRSRIGYLAEDQAMYGWMTGTVFYSSHLLYDVEAVADFVAILDKGRIIRAGRTEDLQREVKRVVLAKSALAEISRPEKLLDVAREADRVAVVLDDSAPWIGRLAFAGVAHGVEDLTLDEIFEAFVIGRRDWRPESFVERTIAVA